jgi:pimeloyl-ACP methyl ester carboxylesterase
VIATTRASLRSLSNVDPTLEDRIVRWLRLTDSIDLDAPTFGHLIGVSTEEAERIAEALATDAVFERHEALVCTSEACGVTLSKESLDDRTCRTCGADLDEYQPRVEVRYVLERLRSRDVGWVIALHGIRTLGPWQEQLQWLIDRQFRRTVPFRNWKYGRLLVGALIPALQRRLVRRFLAEVNEAQNELHGVLQSRAAPPPDVIAHSFGTWIVAHALEADPSLRLGKLILVGSIVRPDWPWAAAFERGQILGVLNYCGDRDPWVRLAERFIPDSGPSGVIGFVSQDQRLLSILRPGGTHSSPFASESLLSTFEDVWRPFLANRGEEVDTSEHRLLALARWSRAAAIWRAPIPLLLALGCIVSLVLALVLLA